MQSYCSIACTEQANRVDITKHKYRDISLPDGMGVPNRQAAQGYGSMGTTLSVHCTIASQTLIFWQHAPAPHISEAPGIHLPCLFRRARNHHQGTNYPVCGESSHSVSWLQVPAKSSTTPPIRFQQREY